MLKHTEDETEQAAAKVRVTPEELAAAIARLEARQETDQRQRDGTVAIGAVVEELGLQATPAEVLAEVQAERVRQQAPQKRQLTLRTRLGISLGLGVIGLGLAGLWMSPSVTSTEGGTSPAIMVPVNTSSVKPQTIGLNSNLPVGDASGKIVLLSEVADNQPVHCRLLNSLNGCFLEPYLSDNYTDDNWTLIKHDGKVYVRGWIMRMSEKVREANGIDVSAHRSVPDLVVPITLSLDSVQVIPGPGNEIEFHAQNIHLDSHVWEKW